mgnify:CR=1 FL=1
MIFYRGFDSKYGFYTSTSFLWVSDNFAIASEYGDSVKICEIDLSKTKFADLTTLESICLKLNYDYIEAIYNPSEEFAEEIKRSGFNAYSIEPCDYSYCCILETSLIH